MLLSFDYTPKERLTFPLRIRIIGKEHAQEEVTRPHGIGPWQWFFCVKGRGEVTINGIRSIIYPVQKLCRNTWSSKSHREIYHRKKRTICSTMVPLNNKFLTLAGSLNENRPFHIHSILALSCFHFAAVGLI